MYTSSLRRLNLGAIALAALSLAGCGGAPGEPSGDGDQAPARRPPLGGRTEGAALSEPKLEMSKPATIGGGGAEYMLVAPSGDSIYAAYGGFPAVSGTGGETDTAIGADAYSVQLNTNFFATACNPSFPYYYMGNQCQGWTQFVYQAGPGTAATAFVEYWIIGVGRNGCPAGWNAFSNPRTGGGYELDCWQDSPHTGVPFVPITSLGSLTLSGSIAHGGNTVTVSTGSGPLYTATAGDYFGLAYGGLWTSAEFNVFGFGGGSEANFNLLTSITVGISAAYGTASNDYSIAAPTCGSGSFTGETNDLILGSCTPFTGIFGLGFRGHPPTVLKYPGIQFNEGSPIIRIGGL